MNTSESLEALRRVNPSRGECLDESVEAAAAALRVLFAAEPAPFVGPARRRRRLVGVSAAGAFVAVAASVAALFTLSSPGGGSGVEDAAAAVRRAATLTAASAERSGTAVVRMTHDGEIWAGVTIRWNGEDLSLSRGELQRRGRPESRFLVVDGTMYVIEDGEWVNIGSPESIDPGSGTTPAEVLAAVREDVGGETLRRIAAGITGVTTQELAERRFVARADGRDDRLCLASAHRSL